MCVIENRFANGTGRLLGVEELRQDKQADLQGADDHS
jgi:hypothetical protein